MRVHGTVQTSELACVGIRPLSWAQGRSCTQAGILYMRMGLWLDLTVQLSLYLQYSFQPKLPTGVPELGHHRYRYVPVYTLAGCMGFLWVDGFSFFQCVASPFHSFVTTCIHVGPRWMLGAWNTKARVRLHVKCRMRCATSSPLSYAAALQLAGQWVAAAGQCTLNQSRPARHAPARATTFSNLAHCASDLPIPDRVAVLGLKLTAWPWAMPMMSAAGLATVHVHTVVAAAAGVGFTL